LGAFWTAKEAKAVSVGLPLVQVALVVPLSRLSTIGLLE
jgi:hypothetical protein